MNFIKSLTFSAVFLFSFLSHGKVELPDGAENKEVMENGDAKPESQVSVLCYHDFSAKRAATEMRVREEAFTAQIKKIHDSGINVISMSDFMAWKRREKELPEKNVLITIDDGWRSVYLVAFPILKEYDFPFSLGLYKEFIDKGALSLEYKMIQEMLNNGMEISSHSVSHPFPSAVKKMKKKGEKDYLNFLKKEFGESKAYLERKFTQKIPTYIYPGGYYASDMFPVMRTYGYEFAFTVKPGKVSRDTVDFEIPRYVVLGTTDHLFKKALQFGNTAQDALVKSAYDLPVLVKPLPEAAITERRPWIGADFSDTPEIARDSIVMRVSGFGKVSGKFLKDTDRFEWQASRPLRASEYFVVLSYKKKGQKNYEEPLKWKFLIDRKSAYINAAESK